MLPRLHGSRRELSSLLDQLGAFCFFGPGNGAQDSFAFGATPDDQEPVLPVSYSKLHRMARRLLDNHFVSYAE